LVAHLILEVVMPIPFLLLIAFVLAVVPAVGDELFLIEGSKSTPDLKEVRVAVEFAKARRALVVDIVEPYSESHLKEIFSFVLGNPAASDLAKRVVATLVYGESNLDGVKSVDDGARLAVIKARVERLVQEKSLKEIPAWLSEVKQDSLAGFVERNLAAEEEIETSKTTDSNLFSGEWGAASLDVRKRIFQNIPADALINFTLLFANNEQIKQMLKKHPKINAVYGIVRAENFNLLAGFADSDFGVFGVMGNVQKEGVVSRFPSAGDVVSGLFFVDKLDRAGDLPFSVYMVANTDLSLENIALGLSDEAILEEFRAAHPNVDVDSLWHWLWKEDGIHFVRSFRHYTAITAKLKEAGIEVSPVSAFIFEDRLSAYRDLNKARR